MKLHRFSERWLVIILLLGTCAYAIAEDITLTTYYPSPRGVYDQLQSMGDTLLAQSGGNVGIGTTSPNGASPSGQPGNLDVNDIWVRSANGGAGGWASTSGKLTYTNEYSLPYGAVVKMIPASQGVCFLTAVTDGSNGGAWSVRIESDGYWYGYGNKGKCCNPPGAARCVTF